MPPFLALLPHVGFSLRHGVNVPYSQHVAYLSAAGAVWGKVWRCGPITIALVDECLLLFGALRRSAAGA